MPLMTLQQAACSRRATTAVRSRAYSSQTWEIGVQARSTSLLEYDASPRQGCRRASDAIQDRPYPDLSLGRRPRAWRSRG